MGTLLYTRSESGLANIRHTFTSPPHPCPWQTSLINHSTLSQSLTMTTKSCLDLAPHRVSYSLGKARVMTSFCYSWSQWINHKDGTKKEAIFPSHFYITHCNFLKRLFESLQTLYGFMDKRIDTVCYFPFQKERTGEVLKICILMFLPQIYQIRV